MADLSKNDISALTDAIGRLSKELSRSSASSISNSSKASSINASKNKSEIPSSSLTKSINKLVKQFEALSVTLQNSNSSSNESQKNSVKSAGAAREAEKALKSFSKKMTQRDLSEIIATASKQAAAGISSGASDSITDARKELINLSVKLKSMGVLGEEFSQKWGNVKHLPTKDVEAFGQALQEAMKKSNLFASGSLQKRAIGLQKGIAKITDSLAPLGVVGKAFEDLAKKVGAAVDLFQKFNSAGIAASLIETNKMSVKLGLTFEETTALIKSSGVMLGKVGPEQFESTMSGLKGVFASFGYNMKEGAKVIGPTIQSGIAGGIDVSSKNIENVVSSTMSSFDRVRAMTGVTAEEYAKMNEQLLSSTGVFESMMGIDKDLRLSRLKELEQRREAYVMGGLSLQQANELIKTQAQQQRESVTNRTKAGGMMMMRAQMAGLSPEKAMRAFMLARKGVRSDEENKELADLQRETAVGLERRRTAEGAATGGLTDFIDTFTEKTALTGSFAAGEKSGMQMEAGKDAGQGMTEKERAAAQERAKGSEALATASNTVNSISSLFNNEFIGAINNVIGALGTFGTALIGFFAAGGVAAIAKGVTSAIPIITTAVTGAAGAATAATTAAAAGGTAAAAGGTAAAAGAGLLAPAAATAAGLAAGATGGYAIVKGLQGEDASNWISNLTDKIGVGTALGDAANWMFGDSKQKEAMKNLLADTPMPVKKPPPTVSQPAPGQSEARSASSTVNSSDIESSKKEEKVTNVHDKKSMEQLILLVESMREAVTYLRTISEIEEQTNPSLTKTTTPSLSSGIPSMRTFLTGRE